jgi:hypothetical protein
VPRLLVVTKTRKKQYPPRPDANLVWRAAKRRRVLVDDPGGAGREIVSERALCPACAAQRG